MKDPKGEQSDKSESAAKTETGQAECQTEINAGNGSVSVSDVDRTSEKNASAESDIQKSVPGFADISEMFRKAVIAGLGAAMVGEESVRSAIRDLTPGAKEAIGSAIDQAGRGREEIRRIVSDEAKRLMDSPVLKREITKSLSSLAIEMTVRIRLNPDGTGPDITFSQPRLCRDKKGESSNSDGEAGVHADSSKTPGNDPGGTGEKC